MKYTEFKKMHNVDLLLLVSLNALVSSRHIFELDHFPDPDLTRYNKHADSIYVFFDKLEFPAVFDTIFKVDKQDVRLFLLSDLERLSSEHDMTLEEDGNYGKFLSAVLRCDKDLAADGHEVDFDGFHLNDVRISSINNTKKTISVMGSYEADSMWIQPMDGKLMLFCDILGIPSTATRKNLYLGLLAEGYSLLRRRNHTLAFFLLYTSMENFIGVRMNAQDDESRLSEKLREMFKCSSPAARVQEHQIYSSIVKEFSGFTNKRNLIAHGGAQLRVSEAEVRELLLFTITMMASIVLGINNFDDLKAHIRGD